MTQIGKKETVLSSIANDLRKFKNLEQNLLKLIIQKHTTKYPISNFHLD
jgi:hypothetical protein